MLLARIITRRAEAASELAAQLRACGYMVETVHPTDTCITPADLQVELESCPAEEALARAAQRAQQIKAEKIVVAAGALGEAHAQADVAVPAADEIARSISAGGGIRAEASHWRALVSRGQHWWTRLLAREPLARRQAEEPGPEVFPGRSELRTADNVSSATDRVPPVDAGARPPETPEDDESTRAEVEPVPYEAAAELAEGHEADTMADEPASPAPVVRVPPIGERTPVSVGSGEEQTTQPVQRPLQHRRPYARLRQREREWRVAVAVAAVFAVVLALGWSAATHPRPAAPLSNAELNHATNIEQQVPFGPVIVHPAVPAATVAGRPPSPPQAVAAPKQGEKADAVVVATRPARRRASRGSRSGGEDDEVVVRHFTVEPQKAPAPSTSQLKRYSDRE